MTDVEELFVTSLHAPAVEVRCAGPDFGGAVVSIIFRGGYRNYAIVLGADTWRQWREIVEAELRRLNVPPVRTTCPVNNQSEYSNEQ